jgi:hypothetical protein
MSIKIKSGKSINEAVVDSNNNLNVNLPTILNDSGYNHIISEVDDGSVIGTPTLRALHVTQDYRLLKNIETPFWQDNFSSSVLNNSKYRATTTNQTIVLSGGCLNLNADSSVGSGNYSMVQTFKSFPIYENAPVYVNFKTKFNNTFQANNIIEFGLATTTGTTTPTDGVFFRVSGGTLNGVVSYSGYETTIVNIYTPTINEYNDYILAITDNNVEFWVDDVIVGKITPTATTVFFTSTTVTLRTAGFCTTTSNSLHLFVRNRNSGVVSSPIKISVSDFGVLFSDFKSNRDFKSLMVTNGQSSISSPDGQPNLASGTTSANILNNLSPTQLSLLDNTTGGYTTLGGDFLIPASGSSETDYILFGYLNPIGTADIPGKTLVISNIYINTFTSGATVNSTGTTLQWVVGVGGTSLSLGELDSVTGGTRSPRRLGLGIQNIPSASSVGTMARPMLMYQPTTPIMIESGTYLHIILKIPIGIETPSLVYRGNVSINGYWE